MRICRALRHRAPLHRRALPRAQARSGPRSASKAKQYMDGGRARSRRDRRSVSCEEASRPAARSATASCSTASRARCTRPRSFERVLDGRPLDLVVNLDVPLEIVLDRISPAGGSASDCQRVYHVNMPPDDSLDLRHLRRRVVQRDDDTEEAVERRLEALRAGDRADHRLLPRDRQARCAPSTVSATGDEVFERLAEGRRRRASRVVTTGRCTVITRKTPSRSR